MLLSVSVHAQSSHRAKASQVPDFLQTDREAGFAKSGSQFCAPTAVSNSLMWLADNGYEELRPAGEAKGSQIAMIKILSGKNFMKTSPSIGTDAAQLMRGVESFVDESGYTISELSYQGWRQVPADRLDAELPDLEAIKTYVADDQSAVWLNVGWYSFDEESEEYERRGGHWVTAVGFLDDDLLIHDPSPAAGSGFRTQRITLEELSGGRLTGNQRNLPRSATGYYEISGEMAKGSETTCILDGVVFMTLE